MFKAPPIIRTYLENGRALSRKDAYRRQITVHLPAHILDSMREHPDVQALGMRPHDVVASLLTSVRHNPFLRAAMAVLASIPAPERPTVAIDAMVTSFSAEDLTAASEWGESESSLGEQCRLAWLALQSYQWHPAELAVLKARHERPETRFRAFIATDIAHEMATQGMERDTLRVTRVIPIPPEDYLNMLDVATSRHMPPNPAHHPQIRFDDLASALLLSGWLAVEKLNAEGVALDIPPLSMETPINVSVAIPRALDEKITARAKNCGVDPLHLITRLIVHAGAITEIATNAEDRAAFAMLSQLAERVRNGLQIAPERTELDPSTPLPVPITAMKSLETVAEALGINPARAYGALHTLLTATYASATEAQRRVILHTFALAAMRLLHEPTEILNLPIASWETVVIRKSVAPLCTESLPDAALLGAVVITAAALPDDEVRMIGIPYETREIDSKDSR